MVRKLLIILLPLLVLLVGPIVLAASTDGSLHYALCQKNIESVKVIEQGKLFSVNIKLTASGTEKFSRLTFENIGKKLDVFLGDTLVTSAIIRAGIKSGSILSTPKKEAEALGLQQRILNNAPESPCGTTK